MRFEYDGLVIDTARLVVERDSASVPVQPQVFDVLAYLLLHRDRVITKEELLDEVWGDRFVSESALTSRIKSARQLVGDDGIAQRAIKTFHGRGYRWVGPVSVDSTAVPVAAGSSLDVEPPPRRLTPLVGRDDDLDALSTLLSQRPLVSLIGPPGVGKSALAGELAVRAQRDGTTVVFADLEPCADPPAVIGALRRSVGVQQRSPDARRVAADDAQAVADVVERLRSESALVVLDNCDVMAPTVAELVARLLVACPELVVLATARRPLGVAGEHVWPVRPLSLPGEDATWAELLDSGAGRLFVDRSAAGGVTWDGSDGEAASIAACCRRVDGLPLGIELAAARSRWMSLDDLLRQHEDELGDASVVGRRNDPLTTAIKSSRTLLRAEQRTAFDALSVFVGSFRIDAALAVLAAVHPHADPLELFEVLVDSSLVDVVGAGGQQRYRLLGPVRAYAESCRIGSTIDDAAVAAHLDHFDRFVRRRWPVGRIATVHPWSALSDERHEIEAAIRRSIPVRPSDARRLLGALGWFWWTGGEAHRWDELADRVDEGAGQDPADVTASFAFVRTLGAFLLGRDPRPVAQAAFTAGLADGQWSIAAWAAVFDVAPDMMWIDLDPVAERWDEIVGLFRRADDLAGEAWATTIVLGYAQVCARRHDDAVRSYEAAARMFDRCGDETGVVRAMLESVERHVWTGDDVATARALFDRVPETTTGLPVETRAKQSWLGGLIAGAEGDHNTEIRLHRDAVAVCERHFPGALLTNTYRGMLGCAQRRAGRRRDAADSFRTALDSLDRLPDAPGVGRHRAWLLERTAGLLVELGRAELAAQLFGSVARFRAELPAPMPYWDEADYTRDVERLEQLLGPDQCRAEWRLGAERPSGDLVDVVRASLRTAIVDESTP